MFDVEKLVQQCEASIPDPDDRQAITAAVRSLGFERDGLADAVRAVCAVAFDAASELAQDRPYSPAPAWG